MITLTCPKCGASSNSSGVRGRRGPDGRDEFLGESAHGSCGHTWETDAAGNLTVLPDPPPYTPYVRTPIPVFDEWATLNQIICPDRSRFDVLQEELPKCKTKEEVRTWIQREGFGSRYPILPESLPD